MSGLRRYARRVEELWSARLERPVILSPREFALIEEWHARGIPLEVVAEAIDATRTDARGKPAAPPRRLGYLRDAVEETWRTVVEGRLRPAAPRGCPPAAEEALASWEEAARRGPAEWAGWLAARIERVRGGADPAAVDREVDAALADVAPPAIRARVAEEVERRLAPHAARMERDVLERTRRRATLDGLRRALGLARLS